MELFNSIDLGGAGPVLLTIIGVCFVLIPIVVFFQFLYMMQDVKRIRTILESWHQEGLPQTISNNAPEDNVKIEEIRVK